MSRSIYLSFPCCKKEHGSTERVLFLLEGLWHLCLLAGQIIDFGCCLFEEMSYGSNLAVIYSFTVLLSNPGCPGDPVTFSATSVQPSYLKVNLGNDLMCMRARLPMVYLPT